MSWSDVLVRGASDPTLTFARRKWNERGKFVWIEPPTVIQAPGGEQYRLCAVVYFKDADDIVKPYQPSMDGMTEADDWYAGVSGRPARTPSPTVETRQRQALPLPPTA
ncbi:Thoeris anti-defense Tad2 family protein [Streptomyces sp. TSRI0281]|uniref:Thoeris anti-defense Tad2 family protein n=2 Tax=unclassified Streptomyces TaxID=2593676 RepID=UPI000ACEB7E7